MSQARSLPFKCSAVISDVDGTLVANDKTLTAPSRAAVAELRANGIIFSIISSRPPRGLRMLLEPLGIKTPVGGFNGGVLAAPDLTVIAEHLLSPEIAQRAVDMLDACEVPVWIFSGQDWLVRYSGGPYVGLEERTIEFGPTMLEDFEPFLDTAAKIVGASADFELLAHCEHDLRVALGGQASVARSQPYYLDVTNPFANKGVALSEMAKLLGVPLAEVATIGDGRNDVAMFERSGLSIAVGNACFEVLRAADFVSESNSEDGFARAIERFILDGDRSQRQVEAAKAGDRTW